MDTTATVQPTVREAGPARWVRRRWLVDAGVALLFLVVAGWLGHGLWPDPATRQLALNPTDQVLIEWFLAVDTRLVTGEHGFITDRLNAPDGVNLLANAASPTLGLLLAPVTLTLGAPVAFAILTIGNLAGTATGWYLLFARTLGAGRVAAATGGGLCGFCPAMVSHSSAHWHMAALWLVPAIVWSVVRLARAAAAGRPPAGVAPAEPAVKRPGPALPPPAGVAPAEPAVKRPGPALPHRPVVTSGLWLAGLVVAQYFLGAEVLYLTALTLALFATGYALTRRAWARQVLPRFAAGLAIAAGTAIVLLAYPLWVQLAGPGSVPNGPFNPHFFSADLASWPAFSPLTIAGTDRAGELATGPAEYNTFLGLPLLLVGVAATIWLRHRPLVVAAAGTAVVMALLSLGPELVVNRTRTGFPLPYELLMGAPVIDGALPQRYAVAVVPLLATILVLALHRAAKTTPVSGAIQARVLVPVGVGLALLPLVPTPLPAEDRIRVPAFITGGHWRDCASPGGVLVPVPLPTPAEPGPMRWAAAADARFALPEGFFIGPYAARGRASVGIAPRPTSQLLAEVASTGQTPGIGAAERAQAGRDLAYWRAECVALDPTHRYQPQLRATLEALFGPGERAGDAWIWRLSRPEPSRP